MVSRPKLYSEPFSHYCVSADRMLGFKGIAYQTIPVMYHDKRDLIAGWTSSFIPRTLSPPYCYAQRRDCIPQLALLKVLPGQLTWRRLSLQHTDTANSPCITNPGSFYSAGLPALARCDPHSRVWDPSESAGAERRAVPPGGRVRGG